MKTTQLLNNSLNEGIKQCRWVSDDKNLSIMIVSLNRFLEFKKVYKNNIWSTISVSELLKVSIFREQICQTLSIVEKNNKSLYQPEVILPHIL